MLEPVFASIQDSIWYMIWYIIWFEVYFRGRKRKKIEPVGTSPLRVLRLPQEQM